MTVRQAEPRNSHEPRAVERRRVPPYDIRLRRELAHRRLVVSMLRRMTRVLSLHLLDATALIATVLALSQFAPFAAARSYLAAIVGIYLLSLNALGAYGPGQRRRDFGRLISGSLVSVLILACLAAFPPEVPLGPWFLVALGAGAVVALALGRAGVNALVRQAYAHGIGLRRVLLVGGLDAVGRVLYQLRDEENVDQYVVGHIAPDARPDPTALGRLADLPALVERHDIEEVIVTTRMPRAAMGRLAEACFARGTSLYAVPNAANDRRLRADPVQIGHCSLVHLHPTRLELPALWVKRTVDFVGVVTASVLIAPLVLLVAIAIKLDSRGPVFFRQVRVGLGGRRFTMYKFRSMYVDAEQRLVALAHLNSYGDARLFKMQHDPRVTRIGRWLRRSSLDELPQLWNVLWGQMSLVGPRPPLPSEVAAYEPHHMDRLTVVPGITGPWQVGGRNLVTNFDQVVEMERAYIQGWSLLVDARIMLRTVRVVVRGDGAY